MLKRPSIYVTGRGSGGTGSRAVSTRIEPGQNRMKRAQYLTFLVSPGASEKRTEFFPHSLMIQGYDTSTS